jgi:hypothetical protein
VEVLHSDSAQHFLTQLKKQLTNYVDLNFLVEPEFFHHDSLIKADLLALLQSAGAV